VATGVAYGLGDTTRGIRCALLRATLLSDPDAFQVFAGLVLLYLGVRLLYEVRVGRRGGEEGDKPGDSSVTIVVRASKLRVEYGYGGKRYGFGTPSLFALSLVVGVVGGMYSIEGGSIIAPFLVTVLGLPVYTVAGATLIRTFVTSVAGVVFFEALAALHFGAQAGIAPDYLLGVVLGVGGLAGTYAGARLQQYIPDLGIRVLLGTLITVLGLRYVL
jgi:uncharacterized membrane protein YfcA